MTDTELTQAILEERQKIDPNTRRVTTWEKIEAEHAGVSKALLWKISRGHIVKDLEKRRMLKLDIMVKVPACPFPGCTDPHQHKHNELPYTPATQEVFTKGEAVLKGSQTVKPTPKPSKPRYRIAIHKQDMRSASESITHNIATYRVRELHTLLTQYLEWADPENEPVLHGQNGAGKGA